MGIFNKKDSVKTDLPAQTGDKKVEVVKETKTTKAVASKKSDKESTFDVGAVIKNPRITEKAAYASDKNVYTFDVAPRASKPEVVKAVKAIYKVTPLRVHMLAIPTKRVVRKNSVGVKGGGKKAYVFLKKGDKIEFV